MNQKITRGLLCVVLSMGFAGLAFATPTPINSSSGETSLQQILDNITVDDPSSVDVNTDQFTPDAHWSVQGSGGAVTQIVIEIAGNSSSNTFGIFDQADPTNTYELFAGSEGSGDALTFGFTIDGTILHNHDETNTQFGGNLFGYYLDTPDGRWYSDSSLNNDNQADHQVAFRGGDGDWIQVGNTAAGEFGGDEYIFGWEDEASPSWDYDYNDFVVIAESITAVPGPGVLGMFGLGLLLLGGALRWRGKAQ